MRPAEIFSYSFRLFIFVVFIYHTGTSFWAPSKALSTTDYDNQRYLGTVLVLAGLAARDTGSVPGQQHINLTLKSRHVSGQKLKAYFTLCYVLFLTEDSFLPPSESSPRRKTVT